MNTNVTTLASTNIESIDRMASSYAEVTNCGDVDAGDSDPYGAADAGAWNDRDAAAGWTDAYVNHNSNTDRTFALSQIDTVITNVRPYWKDRSPANKVMITGDDTELRMGQLLRSQERYTSKNVRMTVNGVQTLEGVDGGMDVATYLKIPIIPDANAIQDTISRVTVLDMDHIHIGVLQPLVYLESEDYQALDKFVREGVFHMEGELVTTRFKGLGKVRDLK